MDRPSINLDAAFLRQAFAPNSDGRLKMGEEFTARLLRIADNIEKLDEANARAYQLGITEGLAQHMARSNIVDEAEGKRRPMTLEQAIAGLPVKRIPMGERALEDKPDKFNAPVRRKPAKPVPKIDLDLSFLGEI